MRKKIKVQTGQACQVCTFDLYSLFRNCYYTIYCFFPIYGWFTWLHLQPYSTHCSELTRTCLKDFYLGSTFYQKLFCFCNFLVRGKTKFLPELLLWGDEAGMEDMGESWTEKEGENYVILILISLCHILGKMGVLRRWKGVQRRQCNNQQACLDLDIRYWARCKLCLNNSVN